MKRHLLLLLVTLLPLLASAYDAEIDSTANGRKEYKLKEHSVWSEDNVVSVNVATPGELQWEIVMLDMDEIPNLKISGALNLDDIKYLRSGNGTIGSVRQLDLSEISIIPDENNYFTISGYGYNYFYLSERDTVIVKSVSGGMIDDANVLYVYSSKLGGVFANTQFERVALPEDLTEIAPYTFAYSNIETVHTSHPITSIGESAFQSCRQLAEMNLSTVESIGDNAFSGSSLNKLGDLCNVRRLGAFSFYDCKLLTGNITLGEGLQTIGKYTFCNCNNILGVQLPTTIREINSDAFYNCSKLNDIVIPEGCTTLGSYAFGGCSALANVSAPSSLLYVDCTAFKGTPFKNTLPIVNGVMYLGNVALTYDGTYFSSNTTLTFRDGTKGIADGFMSGAYTNINEIELPSTLKYIGGAAFYKGIAATSIIIPESVDSIGDKTSNSGYGAFGENESLLRVTYNAAGIKMSPNLFYGCKGLQRVTIGSKVRKLPKRIFGGCSNLMIATFEERTDNTPLSIGENAFSDTKLQRITLPEGVTDIGESAFYGCNSLISINIPKGVTSIGEHAFFNCNRLTSVTINCPNVGSWFAGKSSIKDITLGSTVTSIGDHSFSGCTGLTSIIIPESVTSIGNQAFYGCTGLTSIAISENVTSIGNEAFSGCSGLTSVIIPNSLTSIGDGAFSSCSGLTSVTIPGSVANIGEYAFSICSGLTTITIPNSIESISKGVFYGCSGLTSVTISEGVTTIGDYAFYKCLGLTSIVIPEGVTSIGDYAFSQCNGLSSVTIGSNVTSIGKYAFSATGLTTVSIPANVSYIGNDAFNSCNLTSVNMERATPVAITTDTFTSADEAALFVPTGSLSAYKAAFGWSRFKTIVENTSNYRSKGLYYKINKYLGNAQVIYAPNGTLYSGDPVIQSSVIYSGKKYNVNSIGDFAFYDCENLNSVSIPESVTSIGKEAFSYCTNLSSITIPESVTSIGDETFLGCESLTSVTIPGSLTTIPRRAFVNCDYLTSVTINDGVKHIGESAFRNCISMTTLSIPCTVTNIGEYAFDRIQDFEDLKDVFCYAEQLPSAPETAFRESTAGTATLHVPASAIESYKTTVPWSRFGTIIALIDEDVIKSVKDEEETEIARYDLQGRKLATLQRGINILRYSNGTSRKVVVK